MQRVPIDLIKLLDLTAAATAEANAWRNLLPPEPWTAAVTANASGFAAWVATRLESGARNSPAVTSSARKSNQGTRPVAILGIGERIAYRALTQYVLKAIAPATRSPEDYQEFAGGPITYGYRDAGKFRRLGDSRLSYVVEADIAAFYQYINHDILRRELEMQTGEVVGAEVLSELLYELQGATNGLPQLIEPSDELSEVYVRILQRDLVRQGLLTWRFNDDFRIGATTYDAAQDALEKVSDSARSLGLILNEHKTYISRFLTYLFRFRSPDVNVAEDRFDPDDLQIASEYNLDDSEAADSALERLARIELPASDKTEST